MEGLLATFLNLIAPWDKVFPRAKSALRAKELALSLLMTMGRKLISRSLMTTGRDQQDWSTYYKLFSRTVWSPRSLFRPILAESVKLINESFIAIGFDDTLLKKTGKRINGASWQRDSMSPHFCTNFVWGMRYLQASVLLPLYNNTVVRSCRAVPVQFTQLPKFKKPRKRSSEEQWEAYRNLCSKHNSSTEFVKNLRYLRNELTMLGLKSKEILAVVDASYVNRTTFLPEVSGATIVGRVRKSARMYFKTKIKDGKRFYDAKSYTVEELRQDKAFAMQFTSVHYGGEFRPIRYKDFPEIYWKYGTKRKPLRLLIIQPTPYRRTLRSRLSYREPAFLLTTNFTLSAPTLIQKYMDRWQIEVNFKEEKSQMTLGKQQVWSEKSIPKVPAFIVACYAALTLAAVLCFSESRTHEAFEVLPKWRKKEDRRPSFQDILTVFRKEVLAKAVDSTAGPPLQMKIADLIYKSAA